MIPYEELDRALARWKARGQGIAGETTHEVSDDDSATVISDVPVPVDAYRNGESGSVPQSMEGLPPPSEHTGEIDLGDEAVESYDDDK